MWVLKKIHLNKNEQYFPLYLKRLVMVSISKHIRNITKVSGACFW